MGTQSGPSGSIRLYIIPCSHTNMSFATLDTWNPSYSYQRNRGENVIKLISGLFHPFPLKAGATAAAVSTTASVTTWKLSKERKDTKTKKNGDHGALTHTYANTCTTTHANTTSHLLQISFATFSLSLMVTQPCGTTYLWNPIPRTTSLTSMRRWMKTHRI